MQLGLVDLDLLLEGGCIVLLPILNVFNQILGHTELDGEILDLCQAGLGRCLQG